MSDTQSQAFQRGGSVHSFKTTSSACFSTVGGQGIR
jgi:hypothetical protein